MRALPACHTNSTYEELPELTARILLNHALDCRDLILVAVKLHQARLRTDRDLLAGRLPSAHQDRDKRVRIHRRQLGRSSAPVSRVDARQLGKGPVPIPATGEALVLRATNLGSNNDC